MSTQVDRRAVPVEVRANQPADRFYRGGSRIAGFRGEPGTGTHVPEDWVASTTTLFGETALGLTRLPDGELLRDAVRHDPVAWFGPAHVERFGDNPALLVKLLDAGERLPVHAHPDVPFAAQHLGLTHGKTEAWIVLEPAVVHLAFARDVTDDELTRWVDTQATDAMLATMHTLHLAVGDAVLVPAGLPHAIGAGAFVVELQEPTDLSILLEWSGFDLDGTRDGHLGLGFTTALAAVDRRGWSRAQVEALRVPRGTRTDLLPDAAPFFRAERWTRDADWEAGYAVLVVVAGSGALVTPDGERTELHAGTTHVVPFDAGALHVDAGAGFEILRCRPPHA